MRFGAFLDRYGLFIHGGLFGRYGLFNSGGSGGLFGSDGGLRGSGLLRDSLIHTENGIADGGDATKGAQEEADNETGEISAGHLRIAKEQV